MPCERGTSPGDFTVTVQVTPIRDLIWWATLGGACFARRGVGAGRHLDLDRHGVERALAVSTSW